jgi:YVTN family beta-propeller protein
VWVTSWDNSSLVELDGKDLHLISRMKIDSPNGIAIWQDKGLAYVTNRNSNTVTEIDLVAHKIRRTIAVGSQPFGVTVVQESGVVFVANRDSNDISCIPADGSPAIASVVGKWISLHGPVRLAGFPLNYAGQYFDTALIVDMKGTVAIVMLVSQAYAEKVSGPRCDVESIAKFGEDSLGDVAHFADKDAIFYITDFTGRFVEYLRLIPASTDGTPATPLPHVFQIKLPKSPLAIAWLGGCMGVVAPDQNLLYLFYDNSDTIMGQKKIGNQGDHGGGGLAYNPNVDVAYVTNAADNSVTRIEHSCQ